MPDPKLKAPTEQLLVKKDLEREIRGEAVLAHRAVGRSIREIAALFEVGSSTIHRWLKEAEQNEKLKRAKGIVGERLVPKALAVYDTKLEQGDLEAARDILFGAGVLSKSHKVEVTNNQDPLEKFRKKYFADDAIVEAEEVNESK
jgi:transposase-like protein